MSLLEKAIATKYPSPVVFVVVEQLIDITEDFLSRVQILIGKKSFSMLFFMSSTLDVLNQMAIYPLGEPAMIHLGGFPQTHSAEIPGRSSSSFCSSPGILKALRIVWISFSFLIIESVPSLFDIIKISESNHT
jgi:hypothetical protein